jgi:hypothetical protein
MKTQSLTIYVDDAEWQILRLAKMKAELKCTKFIREIETGELTLYSDNLTTTISQIEKLIDIEIIRDEVMVSRAY